jgi:hypothetical protein
VSERVFCKLRRASTAVADCYGCERCDAVHRGPNPSVECTIPVAPEEASPDQLGERTEVGTLLSDGVLVVEQSASLQDAFGHLRHGGRSSLAVVDSGNKLVGVLHEVTFGRGGVDGKPMRHRHRLVLADRMGLRGHVLLNGRYRLGHHPTPEQASRQRTRACPFEQRAICAGRLALLSGPWSRVEPARRLLQAWP